MKTYFELDIGIRRSGRGSPAGRRSGAERRCRFRLDKAIRSWDRMLFGFLFYFGMQIRRRVKWRN